MMNSAAVIGRQLRQQAVSGRSSGALIPQSQIPFGKNRPRAPSHALIPNRPHSPVPPCANITNSHLTGASFPAFVDHNQIEPTVITFPVQAPSDRLNVTSKLTTGGAINAVVAQREQRALANQLRKLDLQRKNPKLKCTLHCVCIAFKALSLGLFLLIVGTVMSVYGFLLESEQKQKAKLSTETVIPNDEVNARIRNLTYAGPVIMGLGIIVIIAALVLTFEVRDTLGVKEPAPGEKSGNILVEKKQQSKNLAATKVQTVAKNSNLNENGNRNAQNADTNCAEKSTTNQNDESNAPQLNNQLNASSLPQLPMQVCTIENELRKLSNTNLSRIKTPPDTLDLNNKLDSDQLGSLDQLTELNKSAYKNLKHKQIGGKIRKNEQLQLSARTSKLSNLQGREKILETNLDQQNQTGILKTEHNMMTDRNPNLSMSLSMDSTNLTTDNQQVEQLYYGNLASPQELDLSEPSELYSISKSENTKLLKSNFDARCSCTASPENSDQDLENNNKAVITKSTDKSPFDNKSFISSDLNYHFVEQQKIQQQIIAQQQQLLQQQQQLTDLLHEKFINQPRQHSLSSYSYSPLTNKSPFEHKSSKISASFDQTIAPKCEKTISFELTKPSTSLKSLPTTFERSLGASNQFIRESKISSKRIASADLDLNKEKHLKDQTKQAKQRSSLSSSNRPFSSSSKPNRFRTSSSSQNLESNMSDYKDKT